MSGALADIRVLDLSRVLAGPWAAQTLGDLGAEVIKIERPGSGDEARGWGPTYFSCANRNKKSVAVDIAQPEGAGLVRRLAERADVIIENFKAGGLEPYGLDYAAVYRTNPAIVYCSITGFGQTGPYRRRAGYDFLIQGMGGLMSVTGRKDGEPGSGPQKAGVALTDVLTGMYAATAILAALLHRRQTGAGQYIDLALLDVQVASLANLATSYLASGEVPARMGNAHPSIVPYQDFPTSDGAMILAVGNDAQFGRLCAVLGHREWSADERFLTNDRRVAERDVLVDLIRQRTVTRTTHGWLEELEQAGVPCGPINTLAEVFDDPQVKARGLALPMQGESGDVTLVANPIVLSKTPAEYRLAPPALGRDTARVLATELELDQATIDRLMRAGVVA
jgi:crotonobetainyl-CoA:carnitine CoA-transferase CaiB-like acyl-CoA transferase